jgi:caffeoyl-CoA O-methyltransferase
MSNQTIGLTDALHQYLLNTSLREPEVLLALREETAKLPTANMQIAPEQGQFMAMLVHLCGARNIIEVGVYTGYSSLAMALALPENGRLLACDVSEEYTNIAQRYWSEAGVSSKIDLHLAPAIETLQTLRDDGAAGRFDIAFIDADKANYDEYYEHCLALLRQGGLIIVDNVLWGGSVIDPDKQDEDTCAIRAFNQKLLNDQRVDISLVPIGDGLTLARKR